MSQESHPTDADNASWCALKVALYRLSQDAFHRSGSVILLRLQDESGPRFTLASRDATLQLTLVPERHAVRWDTDKEYGFERLSEPVVSIAKTLMKHLDRASRGLLGETKDSPLSRAQRPPKSKFSVMSGGGSTLPPAYTTLRIDSLPFP